MSIDDMESNKIGEKPISRRSALRTLLYIAGGSLVLPACFYDSGSPYIELKNLSLNEQETTLLAYLVDVIIPPTETKCAKALLLHLFVLKMLDDCHSPDEQKKFVSGLRQFSTWSQEQLAMPFIEADTAQQAALLDRIAAVEEEHIKFFFYTTKRRTIRGYMQSKYVMETLVKYELVPGRYDGYYPFADKIL